MTARTRDAAAADARPAPGVVLASGFGGSARQPLLVALGRRLRALGLRSRAVGFGAARPSPGYALELERLRKAAQQLRRAGCSPVVFVGRSFGGRMCAFLAEREPPAALVILGHPIRPPGKVRLEDERALLALRCPTLIIQGDADALGPLSVLRPLVRKNENVTLTVIRGVGHTYRRRTEGDIVERVGDWLFSMLQPEI